MHWNRGPSTLLSFAHFLNLSDLKKKREQTEGWMRSGRSAVHGQELWYSPWDCRVQWVILLSSDPGVCTYANTMVHINRRWIRQMPKWMELMSRCRRKNE